MKEKEKLDLILRALYQYRNYNNPKATTQLCIDNKIPIENAVEQRRLFKELEDLGYIRLAGNTAAAAIIKSSGIQYCEEDSFSNPGHPIIYNSYHIQGDGNIIVSNSSHIRIDINAGTKILNQISETIQKDNSINTVQKEELISKLEELKESITTNKDSSKPLLKFLAIASNVSSIGSFLIDLLTIAKKGF